MSVGTCIPAETLRRFLAEDVPEAEGRALATHVDGCRDCQTALEQLSEVPELPIPDPSSVSGVFLPPDDEPGLGRVLAHLRQMRPEELAGTASEDRTPAAFLSVLDPSDREGGLGMLGPYRILDVLGRGGMGLVLRAEDTALERVVALKALWPNWDDERARTRFVREARAAAGVEHENIVTVYAVETPTDRPAYLVMEYVEGPTLRDRIKEAAWLDPREAAAICLQAAEGLAAAHRAGLVHRDVKPSNIMLDQRSGRAKVLDFGLARATELPSGLTRESTALGTPEYMSPEQVTAPADVDRRADVYGLGVTLYEALTGAVPFRGTPHMVTHQVLTDEPVSPRRLNDRVPRDLETITLKCLAKEPTRRYQTSDDLAADLRRWLHGEPIQARPVSAVERVVKWCARRPTVAGLLLAVALTTLTSVVAITQQWRAAVVARKAADDARRLAEERLLEVERQRDEARREKERADRNFAWARRAVEVTMNKLLGNRRFRDAPEFRELQRELLQGTIAFYEDLARQRSDDPSLKSDLGRAYWRSGAAHAYLNDTERALADVEHMQAIFGRLAASDQGDPEYRTLWGWSFCWQGMLLEESGRTAEAEVAHDRAVAILEAVLAQHPDYSNAIVKLEAAYMHRGDLARDREQPTLAAAWYDRAMRRFEPPLPADDAELASDRWHLYRMTCERQAATQIALRQWDQAVAAFARIVELKPDDPYHWYEYAIAHLGAGDLDGYRRVCAGMLERFGGTQSPEVANRMLYTCVPVADAVADPPRLMPLAEMAASLGRGNVRILGAAWYRNANFEAAARHLEETANHQPLGGWDQFFLAMAHSRLGHGDRARGHYEQGVLWLEKMQEEDPAGKRLWGWTERVETQCLRREAEAVLQGIEAPSGHRDG